MTRAEVHRRYAFHPEIKSAELIEGVFHLASRLRARDHGDQNSDMNAWLGGYRAPHSDVRVSSTATVILDHDSRVQEYIVWRVLDAAIDEFALQDGQYVVLTAETNGVVESAACLDCGWT